MTVKIYADAWKRAQIEPQLIWATEGRGFPSIIPIPPARSAVGPSRSQGVAFSTQATSSSSQLSQKEQRARAAELRDILNNLEKVDDQERRSSLLDQLCSTDVLDLPLYPRPPGIETGELKVNLLRHQVRLIVCASRPI